jgi:hypothetical protein
MGHVCRARAASSYLLWQRLCVLTVTLIDDMEDAKRIARNSGIYRDLVCPKCGGAILLVGGEYVCEENCRASCEFRTQTLGELSVKT